MPGPAQRPALGSMLELERFAADGFACAALRGATWLGILLFPALLVVVGTGASELFVLAAITGSVVWFRRHRTGLRRLHRVERIAATGCLVFVASVLVSIAQQDAAYPAVREVDTLLRPLLAIPLLYLMIRTRPPEGVLWSSMALAAAAAGIYGLLAVAGADGYLRVRGGIGPIHYGTIAIVVGFITTLGLARAERFRTAYLVLAILALALGLTGGFLSGSRGAWTTLPVLAVLLAWHYWQPGFRRYAIGSAIAIVLASTAAYAISETGVQQRVDRAISEVQRYFENPRQQGGTPIGQRFEMWRAGWALFTKHPVLGGGVGKGFNRYARQGIEDGRYHPAIGHQDKVHNSYLEALATRGVIGMGAFLGFLGAFAWIYGRAAVANHRRSRALGVAGLMLLSAYMVIGLTDSVFDYAKPMAFFVVVAMVIVHFIAETPGDGGGVGRAPPH